MKKNIEKLLADERITNYKISKETGISQSTISGYATGKSLIGNMKLDHAELLNNLYLKFVEENKMKNFRYKNLNSIEINVNGNLDLMVSAYAGIRFNNRDPEQRPSPESIAEIMYEDFASEVDEMIFKNEDTGEWVTGFTDIDTVNTSRFIKVTYSTEETGKDAYLITVDNVKTWSEEN